MTEVLCMLLMTAGAAFMLLAGVGVLRMPDLYLRMSAATKAQTLGVGCLVSAAAVHFHDTSIAGRAAAIIAFLFLTAPVAAHIIGRAAYDSGVPLWDRTLRDELRERREAERSPGPASPGDAREDGG